MNGKFLSEVQELEIGAESCEAGTDAARDSHIKTCEAGTDSARQTPMEDVPVEASLLRFVDAVGGTPVVSQMQIPMVQTEIEALRGQLRVISHDIQEMYAGTDEFLARKNELRGLLNECAQKLDALLEQKSRILGEVSEAEMANLDRNKPLI